MTQAGESVGHRGGLSLRAAIICGGALLLAVPDAARAHVRWFADAAHAHTAPESMAVLLASPLFLALLLGTVAVLAWVRHLDVRLAAGGSPFTRLLAEWDARMTPAAAPVLRFGVGLFFAAVAFSFRDAQPAGATDLRSPADWVVPLQLLIALGLLFPSGVLAACAGMLLLYLYPSPLHDAVHLLDYQLLFGICFFLLLNQFSPRHGAATGLLVLRVLVAGNFLWVGMERWLYPEWMSGVLLQHLPVLRMVPGAESWLMAIGFVEVAFAFVVLFGGVSSQLAAGAMLAMMVAATPLVGVSATLADLPMLFSLFVLAATRNRLPRRSSGQACWQPATLCRLFLLGTTGLTSLYYLGHDFTLPRLAGIGLVVALAGIALAWWMRRISGRHPESHEAPPSAW